jgi:hypothetical protein
MSLPLPPAPPEKPKPGMPTWGRVAIWVIVGGIGLYLVISGALGIIAKGG